ncbi:MAG: hypothetical protein Q9219_007387 [cf. Caloplaca sp. 3 TL-2023]
MKPSIISTAVIGVAALAIPSVTGSAVPTDVKRSDQYGPCYKVHGQRVCLGASAATTEGSSVVNLTSVENDGGLEAREARSKLKTSLGAWR